jgi:hypothetical protein
VISREFHLDSPWRRSLRSVSVATSKRSFHSPCFDGIVLAVLAWDFLKARARWVAPDLEAVNYERREMSVQISTLAAHTGRGSE